MKADKNLIPYCITGAVFLLLKAIHGYMDNNGLLFLLSPTSKIVVLFTGAEAQYIPQDGFYFKSLNMIIDKSCSGFNFMLICYAVLIYVFYNYYSGYKRYVLVPILLLLSYSFTISVNASRIISALYMGKIYPETKIIPWMHEALGALIYLSFLILLYLCFSVILARLTNRYEKPVQP